jgi:DNA-binding response OmpR family regulator
MTSEQFTVLVVDDDSMTSNVIVDLLRDEGITALQAGSCREALDLYAPGKFQAIILDNQLGDGLGIELCRRFRETDQEVPMFLFAGASEEIRLEALERGITEVLQKPFDLSKLTYLIKRAARREKSSGRLRAPEQ